jgi:hypothetical protein
LRELQLESKIKTYKYTDDIFEQLMWLFLLGKFCFDFA